MKIKHLPVQSLLTIYLTCSFLLVTMVVPSSADDKLTQEQTEFFESRVRPILVESCYECHNSVKKAEGDLKLDYRDGIREAIDFDDPAESMLLQVIRHEIEDVEMPSGGPKLEPKVISDLAKWIRMGAPDPRDNPPTREQLAKEQSWESTLARRKDWWCFQPIGNELPPNPRNSQWSNHPVDRFILHKLESKQLSPATEADRLTLLRRLTFALTGLPPTPEQIKAFDNDPSGESYEQLVDQLLASKLFGERWARHWMDWMRFAESHGSEGDPRIPHAFRYRDYLVRALNHDVPYDQLVREHVAGDLLENPRINEELGLNESAIGTAHWRMVFHGFAPTDALDEKIRFTDDQINTFSKAFLGLTVSCARCHNHKFDAISHADYYAMFGILNSTRPAMLDVNSPDRQLMHRETLSELKQEIRPQVATDWLAELEKMKPGLDPNWTKAIAGARDREHVLNPLWHVTNQVKQQTAIAEYWHSQRDSWENDSKTFAEHRSSVTQFWSLSEREDYQAWFQEGNGVAQNNGPSAAGVFAMATNDKNVIQGIYPAGVYSHLISDKHAGVLCSPRFKVAEKNSVYLQIIGGDSSVRYAVQNYPRNGTVYPVGKTGPDWKWQSFKLHYWTGDDVHLELSTAADAPLLAASKDRSWIGIRAAFVAADGQSIPPLKLAEYRGALFDPSTEAPSTREEVYQHYRAVIAHCIGRWSAGKMTDSEALFLDGILKAGLVSNTIEKLPSAKSLVEKYRQLENQVPIPTRVVGLNEADQADQPLLLRGNHKTPSDPVPRRFLEVIDPTPYQTSGSGRLELAQDLLRADNPLTSRVIVNRIWHHLFDRGIVATPDNFGRLGSKPTHPELLDFLARYMVENKWSMKRTIKFLVMSKAWRMSSRVSRKAEQLDPDNQLLSHANVKRLEAEAIRDALIAVSDSFNADSAGSNPWRSLYIRVQRNKLDPFLRAFDFPEPLSSTGRRDVTNVPAQSLLMMNSAFVNSRAKALAKRTNTADGRQRVDLMYRMAFGRGATEDEIAAALGYIAETQGRSSVVAAKMSKLRSESAIHREAIADIYDPVHQRLLAELEKESGDQPVDLKPVGRWEFDEDLRDSVGSAHGVVGGNAKIEAGGLVVAGGQDHAVTAKIPFNLSAKTLEAWVQLGELNQRAGGVITVQTPNGSIFDSIVFAERDARQWMAGSNGFSRTKSFSGPQEGQADKQPVHIVIAYHEDGRIIGYRDGVLYGSGYQSKGPQKFKANETVVSFGVRHLPVTAGRMLSGKIVKAQLYDRALSAEEVAASFRGTGQYVSGSDVMDALTDQQRATIADATQALASIEAQIEKLGPVSDQVRNAESAWVDLARAMFNFKEFIYLK